MAGAKAGGAEVPGAKKGAVFGILKRGDKVHTKIIADASGATPLPVIERKVKIVYSDRWKGCNTLDVSGFHHRRINHTTAYVNDEESIPQAATGRRDRPAAVGEGLQRPCGLDRPERT